MSSVFLLFVTSLLYASDPTMTGSLTPWPTHLLANGKEPVKEWVLSNDFLWRWSSGLYVETELWLGLEDFGLHSKGNELDITLGYRRMIGRLQIDLSYFHGDINPIMRANKGDFDVEAITFSYPVRHGRHTTAPFTKFEVGEVTGAPARNGTAWRLGLDDSWRMGHHLVLDQKLFVLHTSQNIYGLTEGEVLQYWVEAKPVRYDRKTKKAQPKPWSFVGKVSVPLSVRPGDIRENVTEASFRWHF